MTELVSPPVPNATLHHIRVEDIQVINRKRKDLGDIESLRKDIEANGQLQPGMVRPVTPEDVAAGADPEVPWILVTGERRYRAVTFAGLDTYMAINRGELPPLEQRVFELAENLNRKEMTFDEQAKARAEIHELRKKQAEARGEDWTLADTAKELGTTNATLSREIKVAEALRADPALKAAGSSRAVSRIIDMRAFTERQAARVTRGVGKLSDLLVCADARDWLRSQPSMSTDAVISDFPYGGDFHKLGMKNKPGVVMASDYDDTPEVTLDLFADVVPEVIRITSWEGWIAIFISESNYDFLRDLFESCCTTHYKYAPIKYVQSENGDWEKIMPTKCEGPGDGCHFLRAEVPKWVWYRPNSMNPARFPELHAKNFYENILVFNRGKGRLYKHQNECPNVLVFDSEYGTERIHSMQKPRALGRELAQRFTQPGQHIVDPFFGSGNLLAGAAELQRKIRGCELNPMMVDLALGNVSKYYGG